MEPDFGGMLRQLREQRGLSLRDLGRLAHRSKSHLQELETGRKTPTLAAARQLDEVLTAEGRLCALVSSGRVDLPDDDECEAWELARRVEASDVGTETLDRIENAVDELASAYPTSLPEDLLVSVRRHLAYVQRLLDGRPTLSGHRRLMVAGAWMALLRATVHVDLRQSAAAEAFLVTAERMAAHSEHREIAAWCLETRAWKVLTTGDYPTALALAQRARLVAPCGGSAYIQATAQEGRAWARLGDGQQTRNVLDQVARLTASLAVPDQPEHHYRYDPGKAAAYTATTLAWAGDPAAEEHARAVVADLDPAGDGGPRPRRAASARLDLGLALLAAGEPEQASVEATSAITSGRVVPSNWWRATEVRSGVERSGLKSGDLWDAYEQYRPRK